MRIAGFGFRRSATLSSLRAALAAAGGGAGGGIAALATAREKAGAEALLALAAELHVPIYAIAHDDLAATTPITQSPRVAMRFGTGSVAEAAALAGAGPGARLLGPRAASADGMATAAIAEGVVP